MHSCHAPRGRGLPRTPLYWYIYHHTYVRDATKTGRMRCIDVHTSVYTRTPQFTSPPPFTPYPRIAIALIAFSQARKITAIFREYMPAHPLLFVSPRHTRVSLSIHRLNFPSHALRYLLFTTFAIHVPESARLFPTTQHAHTHTHSVCVCLSRASSRPPLPSRRSPLASCDTRGPFLLLGHGEHDHRNKTHSGK